MAAANRRRLWLAGWRPAANRRRGSRLASRTSGVHSWLDGLLGRGDGGPGGFLDLIPDPQEIAAPQFGDVGFRVATGQQFGGDVADVADVLPAFHATAFIEVRTDADVVDADLAHRVVD